MEGYSCLEAFEFEKDYWETYEEQLSNFLKLLLMKALARLIFARKRNSAECLQQANIRVILMLSMPDKPTQKTFDELCAPLNGRCSKTPLLRLKFHSRDCTEDKSITEYIATLWKLGAEYEFTDVNKHLHD